LTQFGTVIGIALLNQGSTIIDAASSEIAATQQPIADLEHPFAISPSALMGILEKDIPDRRSAVANC